MPTPMTARAVFLDRDGVLVEDVNLLTSADQARILEGVPEALRALHEAGFKLLVVSNQSVVARGLISEDEVESIQGTIASLLQRQGAPALDGFYYCPHHPEATVAAFRRQCQCRKPLAGMLEQAALDHGVALDRSFMVGDRPTDIAAGRRAGCRTIWVQTGRHNDPLIQVPIPFELPQADFVCPNLAAAAEWILRTP